MSEHDELTLAPGIALCDYVLREHGSGKCTLIGTFHGFGAPSFPSPPRGFWVNVSLTNFRGQMKEMNVTCRIETKDGLVISNVSGKIAPTPGSDQARMLLTPCMVIDMPFPFFNVVIPAAGIYTIAILVDGDKVGERRVEAVAMPPAPQFKIG